MNDNCPEFREPRYSETVPENITVGTIILSVEAFDRDTSGQTQLNYSTPLGIVISPLRSLLFQILVIFS